MSAVRGFVVVLLGGAGVLLVLSAHPRIRRPALARRLTPYLGALGPRRSALLASGGRPAGIAGMFEPVRAVLGARLQRLLDDGQELPDRLRAAGSPLDVSGFRAEQVTYGLGGLVSGIGLGLLLGASGRRVSAVFVLVMAAALGAAGVAFRDRLLAREVEDRRTEIRAALPTVVDLVCLSVTAGESLRSALNLVAESSVGPLTDELGRALRASRAGLPLTDALAASARVVALEPFDRFVDAVAAAQSRGIPLADALRSLAFDLREQHKRDLIEAAGRKQVSMLVPVIALILPVAIVFAFYPGVVAIRTLAR